MMTNKLEQETFKPLFISRSDICVVLGMKPTTLDAFIYRTENFPEKKVEENIPESNLMSGAKVKDLFKPFTCTGSYTIRYFGSLATSMKLTDHTVRIVLADSKMDKSELD